MAGSSPGGTSSPDGELARLSLSSQLGDGPAALWGPCEARGQELGEQKKAEGGSSPRAAPPRLFQVVDCVVRSHFKKYI